MIKYMAVAGAVVLGCCGVAVLWCYGAVTHTHTYIGIFLYIYLWLLLL